VSINRFDTSGNLKQLWKSNNLIWDKFIYNLEHKCESVYLGKIVCHMCERYLKDNSIFFVHDLRRTEVGFGT
jgi:hypothetical protein